MLTRTFCFVCAVCSCCSFHDDRRPGVALELPPLVVVAAARRRRVHPIVFGVGVVVVSGGQQLERAEMRGEDDLGEKKNKEGRRRGRG